jgi:hypothetical protein
MPKFKVTSRPGQHDVVVRPSFETVKKTANSFKVENKTTGRIWVIMPAGVLDQNQNGVPDAVNVYPIDSGGDRDFSTWSGAVDGAYSFPIFCEETFGLAKANSDPEFIVE